MVTREESRRLLPWPPLSQPLQPWCMVGQPPAHPQAQGGSGQSTWPGTLMTLPTEGSQHPGEAGSLPLFLLQEATPDSGGGLPCDGDRARSAWTK